MEPILSNIAKSPLHNKSSHNEPHDLLARLYREIGISAVAAALQIKEEGPKSELNPVEKRVELLAAKAA